MPCVFAPPRCGIHLSLSIYNDDIGLFSLINKPYIRISLNDFKYYISCFLLVIKDLNEKVFIDNNKRTLWLY